MIATLQPYLIWHDVHGNREILDQLLGAAMFGLALLAQPPTLLAGGGARASSPGIAILSNSRLVAAAARARRATWLWRRAGWLAAAAVPVLAVVALAPWVVRNKVEVGCFAITTDARALWKANNLGTYATLAQRRLDRPACPTSRSGGRHRGRARGHTPQEAGDVLREQRAKISRSTSARSRATTSTSSVQFWEHHPGAKVKLMAQATVDALEPAVERDRAAPSAAASTRCASWSSRSGWSRSTCSPSPASSSSRRAFRALALIFVGYETLAAWVFAGTTRYRVPWDFVLALLAAAAIERLPFTRLPFRRPFSQ